MYIYITIIALLLISCDNIKDDNKQKKAISNNKNIEVVKYGFNGLSNDISSNKINLTNYNSIYKKDRHNNSNNSICLDGERSYLKTNISNNLNLSTQFTISLWIKPNYSNCKFDFQGYTDVIGRWYKTGKNNSSFSLVLTKEKKVEFRTYNYKLKPYNTWVSCDFVVPENKWTHIIATRDALGVMNIYINGVHSASKFSNPPQASNYELYIGKRRDNRSYFSGCIDDIIILNEYIDKDDVDYFMNYFAK